MDDVLRNLGYRIKLLEADFVEAATPGEEMTITILLENEGWAAPYNPRNAELILRSVTSPSTIYVIPLSSDVRFYLPGQTSTIDEQITIPLTILSGDYDLLLNFPDAASSLHNRPEYAIRLANKNTWESTTGYNDLQAQISISNVTTITDEPSDSHTINVFPNPTSNTATLQFKGETNHNIELINNLGQVVATYFATSNSQTIDLTNQPKGIYILKIKTGNEVITKEVIKH